MFKLILNSIIVFSFLWSLESIAIVTKSKGDVTYKHHATETKKNEIDVGLEVFNNDFIKTGNDGFVKFVYLDDGSTIKIHQNSELYVRGTINKRQIAKQINIDNGLLKIDVSKQKSDEFSIVTPTSVASVKGTKFWVDCDGPSGDRFFGLNGIVKIQNKETGKIVDLTTNTTAVSLPDGSIDVGQTIPSEMNELLDFEIESGEVDDGGFEDDTQSDTVITNEENELRIQIKDESGNTKTIVIKYK
jgi:hypothetical protein